MRGFNGGVCAYNQSANLFERSQNALRQRSFGRARGFHPMKRRRDSDSDSDVPQTTESIKRLRVSSPQPQTDSEMTDEEATKTDKALIPTKRRPLMLHQPWKTEVLAVEQLEIPTDEPCRALVVFDPYQSLKISREPKVELVESDDEKEQQQQKEEFVRFEELSSDNEEPVDMDVD